MIGLDTSILVRYFAQDDPVQSPLATSLLERRFTRTEPGYVSLVTMAETVWVLVKIYGLSAPEIVEAVERMLQADTLAIQNEPEVFEAMMVLKSGRGSFPDALIGAIGVWAGCSHTLTFDRKAARLPGLEIVG